MSQLGPDRRTAKLESDCSIAVLFVVPRDWEKRAFDVSVQATTGEFLAGVYTKVLNYSPSALVRCANTPDQSTPSLEVLRHCQVQCDVLVPTDEGH